MDLPVFYLSSYQPGITEFILDEDNSRHIVQVLRMGIGQPLQLTDGRGHLMTAVIAEPHKKKCRVTVQTVSFQAKRGKQVYVAISLLKNAARFEWFLEKATEMGVSGIIPLLCERTERQHFREDRLRNILVSAMLQSQQTWLPDLQEPTAVLDVIGSAAQQRRFIAHCVEEQRTPLSSVIGAASDRGDSSGTGVATSDGGEGGAGTLILIGPEGDFSSKEIGAAIGKNFLPVTLGETRLRTETAGVAAAALLCIS